MTADKGPREAIEVARLAGVPLKIAAKMREKAEIRLLQGRGRASAQRRRRVHR